MSGRILAGRRVDEPRTGHECRPPMLALVVTGIAVPPRVAPQTSWVPREAYVGSDRLILTTRPAYDLDAVWLCDECGTVHVVRRTPVTARSGYRAGEGAPRWEKAGPWLSRRARRYAAREAS